MSQYVLSKLDAPAGAAKWLDRGHGRPCPNRHARTPVDPQPMRSLCGQRNSVPAVTSMIIKTHAFARAGLVGNPSDGYFGKTISFVIRNFKATVQLWESPRFEIIPTHGDLPSSIRSAPSCAM
jgi:hypothetical protein